MHSLVGKVQRILRPTTSTTTAPELMSSSSSSSYTLLHSPSTTASSTPNANKWKKNEKTKKGSFFSEVALFVRLLRFKMPSDLVLLFVMIIATLNLVNLVTCEPMEQKATYISSSRLAYNPYSSNSVQQQLPAASEIRPSVVKKVQKPKTVKNTISSVRRTPQWTTMDQIPALPVGAMQYHFNTNHAVMVAEGKNLNSALAMDNLTTAESQLRKEKRQIGGVLVIFCKCNCYKQS